MRVHRQGAMLAAAGLMFVGGCALNEQMAADRLVSSTAPDFTLMDMNGKDVSLSSYRGKVVLLAFWGAG